MARVVASVETRVELPSPLDFSGPRRSGLALQFYGPLKGYGSIASVAGEIAAQVLRHVPSAGVCNYYGPPLFRGELEPGLGLDRSAPVGFFYGYPGYIPDFFYDHQVRIAGFVCESESIPAAWVERLQKMDLVIVPSEFCRRAFFDSGVTTPIMAVGHGLEPEFRPGKGPPADGLFTFLNVFSSRFADRKSAEELIRCFRRVFGGMRSVRLRLRVDEPGILPGLIQAYDAEDLVHLDMPDRRDVAILADCYRQAHCTVHPTRSEGFGLIPLQSIACATPVIAPRHTALREYLDDTNSMEVRMGRGDVSLDLSGHPLDCGYRVDEPALEAALHRMWSEWDRHKSLAAAASPGIRGRFGWDAALRKLMTLLRALVDAAGGKDCRDLIREAAATRPPVRAA